MEYETMWWKLKEYLLDTAKHTDTPFTLENDTCLKVLGKMAEMEVSERLGMEF